MEEVKKFLEDPDAYAAANPVAAAPAASGGGEAKKEEKKARNTPGWSEKSRNMLDLYGFIGNSQAKHMVILHGIYWGCNEMSGYSSGCAVLWQFLCFKLDGSVVSAVPFADRDLQTKWATFQLLCLYIYNYICTYITLLLHFTTLHYISPVYPINWW